MIDPKSYEPSPAKIESHMRSAEKTVYQYCIALKMINPDDLPMDNSKASELSALLLRFTAERADNYAEILVACYSATILATLNFQKHVLGISPHTQ